MYDYYLYKLRSSVNRGQIWRFIPAKIHVLISKLLIFYFTQVEVLYATYLPTCQYQIANVICIIDFKLGFCLQCRSTLLFYTKPPTARLCEFQSARLNFFLCCFTLQQHYEIRLLVKIMAFQFKLLGFDSIGNYMLNNFTAQLSERRKPLGKF